MAETAADDFDPTPSFERIAAAVAPPEPQHTQGRWHADGTGVFSADYRLLLTASVIEAGSVEAAEANARQAAAAPDLLAVLRVIEGGHIVGGADMALAGNWKGIVTALQAVARAAVAAAECR